MKHRLFMSFALLVALVLGQPDANAQGTQKVSIENGIVYVNGTKVPPERLPKALQSIPKSTTMKMWSDDDALMEIDGAVYAIENGTLVEVDPKDVSEEKITVFMTTDPGRRLVRPHPVQPPRMDVFVLKSEDRRRAMEEYMTSMQQRAEEFQKIGFEIDEVRGPEMALLANRLKLEAENAARMAEAFPKVQLEAYLAEIHDANRTLHDQLMREQQMEMETHHLAMKIRDAQSRSDQERLTEDLRKTLDEIFVLKQKNRKKEIEELSAKLNELQKNLKERESHRESIVENRLRELLDQYRW